jgi:hypothetical protein
MIPAVPSRKLDLGQNLKFGVSIMGRSLGVKVDESGLVARTLARSLYPQNLDDFNGPEKTAHSFLAPHPFFRSGLT